MSNLYCSSEPKIEKNNDSKDTFSLLPELEECVLKINSPSKSSDDLMCDDMFLMEPPRLSRTQSCALSEEYKQKEKDAKEAYMFARDCGSYEYYKFALDFPEEEEEEEEELLIKCPTCEEMIYNDDQNGMCYSCFKNEQTLYPDDIPMELRYRNV